MTTAEVLQRANLVPVKNGRMSRIGWYAGYLVVEYPCKVKGEFGGPCLSITYIYGPSVAECERDKLLRVPYPDGLLNQLNKKHNWQSHKVK